MSELYRLVYTGADVHSWEEHSQGIWDAFEFSKSYRDIKRAFEAQQYIDDVYYNKALVIRERMKLHVEALAIIDRAGNPQIVKRYIDQLGGSNLEPGLYLETHKQFSQERLEKILRLPIPPVRQQGPRLNYFLLKTEQQLQEQLNALQQENLRRLVHVRTMEDTNKNKRKRR